ncbi:MAG TPA: 30S ribosomal protein S21 [Dehalococcoidia bacterium]|jgi:ribosomal protein S21|nr:30S ribosomal protein S21 [Dehalococcoidia bacterium]
MRLLMVELREGESPENLLRRFRSMVEREGVLREAKARRRFVSNGEIKRQAKRRAMRRARRKMASRAR